MWNFKYTDREKQYFNKSLGNSDNREVFAEVVVYPHQEVDKAQVAKHLNKDLKDASWHKVSFDDELITIRFDAYLPFLDSKHDDSEVIFNLVEDAYADCDYDITQSELMAKIFRFGDIQDVILRYGEFNLSIYTSTIYEEDTMANIKEMYGGSIWTYCDENDYKTDIDEYDDDYNNHDRVVIIKNRVYFEPKPKLYQRYDYTEE